MSNTKHTPGPWGLDFDEYGDDPWANGHPHECTVFSDSTGEPVASLEAQTYPPNAKELVANARLIAAAPDLLEALKRAMRDGWTTEVVERSMDAIAKATGREAG